MTPADRPSLIDRLYAVLLRAYPKRFRARFEREMRDAVRADHARVREQGAGATARFVTRTAAEAVYFGMAERRGSPDPNGHFRPSRWAIDWRDAYRSLRATPVVVFVAVLSLGLGIGANTALFSILDSLILKTLPVRAPEQLFVIDGGDWTNPIWEQIRDRYAFHQAFAWNATRFNLSDRGETDYVSGVYASGDMFSVLGVSPVLGRAFTAADDVPGGGPDGPVAVISHGFWQRRYGGAASVIGQHLVAERVPFTIIGVAPAGFFGPDVGRSADLFVPIADIVAARGNTRMIDGRSTWWLEVMGRLGPGQSLKEAGDAIQRLQPAIRQAAMPQDWPAKDLATFLTEPMQLVDGASGESQLRKTYAKPLQIILAVVGAVLIIACANIASLLLARATARRRELSLRLALGASRARVARQLLAESLMLSGAGAVLGLIFAQWGSALLVHQLSGREAVTLDLAPDWRVLAFTAGVAVLTALLFGLAPAAGVARLAPNDALKEQGRSVIGDRRIGARNVLVVGQVALSLALVLGGALFLRTFSALTTASLGIDPGPVAIFDISASRLSNEEAPARFARLQQEVEALPGAAVAAWSEITPAGGARWNTIIEPGPGIEALTERQRLAWVNPVTTGWFKAYGIPLRQGRDFDEHDVQTSTRVAIVNESFARKYLPGRAAVGNEFKASPEGPTVVSFQVVGVVGDSIYRSPRAGLEPIVYFPLTQMNAPKSLSMSVRTAGSPAALMPSIARTIARSVPESSFTSRLLTDQLGATVRQERLVAILAGFFGGLALLLAALGLYGVTSYAVSRRRAEIGIRMALGADRAGVLRLVISRVLWLVVIGVALGGLLSVWASQYIETLLFKVTARDPTTFAIATAVLVGAALLAGWLPARRAASIDPATVLRDS